MFKYNVTAELQKNVTSSSLKIQRQFLFSQTAQMVDIYSN